MSTEVLHKLLMSPFVNESIASLGSMTQYKGEAGDYFEDSVDQFRFKGYAVCTEVQGDLDGVILMHHYPETAQAIGAQVFEGLMGRSAQSTDSMNEELATALAEWGNTIVGRATNVMAQQKLSFRFSAPQTVLNLDDMDKYLDGVTSIVSVPIHVADVGRYYFNLLIRRVNYDDNAKASSAGPGSDIPPIKPLPEALPKDSQILLVDDSALIRNAMKRLLAGLGYENVVQADDGKVALEKITNEKPSIVFMDIVMNEMGGYEALQHIRESDQTLPVVMLTSINDQAVIQQCLALGVQGFVVKPLNKETGPGILAGILGLSS